MLLTAASHNYQKLLEGIEKLSVKAAFSCKKFIFLALVLTVPIVHHQTIKMRNKENEDIRIDGKKGA